MTKNAKTWAEGAGLEKGKLSSDMAMTPVSQKDSTVKRPAGLAKMRKGDKPLMPCGLSPFQTE
jgi:hypothetical protein